MIWFYMLPALSWFSLLLLCFFPFIPVGLLMKTWGSNTPNTPRRYRGRVENIREMHQKHLFLPGVFKLMEELPNYSVRVDLHENAPVTSHNKLSVFFLFHPFPHSCFLVRMIWTEESQILGPPNITFSVKRDSFTFLYYKLEYAEERKCKAKGKGWNQNSRLLVANSEEQPINVWRPPTSSKCLRRRKNSQHSLANSSNIIIPPITDEWCYGTTLSQRVSWKVNTRNKERWEICSSVPINYKWNT